MHVEEEPGAARQLSAAHDRKPPKELADFENHPALLRQCEEDVGSIAQLRMRPAAERLVTDDLARVEVHDRLVQRLDGLHPDQFPKQLGATNETRRRPEWHGLRSFDVEFAIF